MRSRRFIFVIPLTAVVIVGLMFYAIYTPTQLALHFNTLLVVQIINRQQQTQHIYPAPNIGNPGGIMSAQQYSGDGVDGFYPIYTRDATGLVHVGSTVVRNYSLADFFRVWGEPLSANNTLGYNANYTSTGERIFFWDMCVRESGSPNEIPIPFDPNHVLRDGEIIRLLYSLVGC
jgi:hypothetical protein